MKLPRLPVDELIPRILDSLESHPSLVLQAAPGTGKTTRVPPALLRARFLAPGQEVVVLEPRRLAAKMSAHRVAQELGESVGQTVGYHFRFEKVTGPRTRLCFLTEGMLMRRLMSDPTLAGVGAVVLDEFHERHLHSDVALAFLRALQRGARKELRLVVMSATLDTESLARFLGDGDGGAPVIQAAARQFDVELEYLPQAPARHLDLTVRDAVLAALPKARGDFLVFLPGMADIRRAAAALEPLAGRHHLVLAPLHGELAREEQDAAVRPLAQEAGAPERRKVILATNVAETSLTIEGVHTVIDSGLHRQASHSWWSGVPALRTRPVSRASAIQRAGRAGRLGPGRCVRLYTRGDFDGRPAFEAPEIQRADLAQTVLELAALGALADERFAWFEAPQPQALQAARGLLERLGALEGPRLTELGRRMAKLPAHPRLARLLLEAERLGALEDAASLAAMITEGALEGLDPLQSLRQARPQAAFGERAWRVRSQLVSAFERGPRAAPGGPQAAGAAKLGREDRLRFALLCGFPDRVARKRPGQDPASPQLELLLSSGGSVRIENSAALGGSETFVILELQEKQYQGQSRATTRVESLCEIREEWLFDLEPTALTEVEEPVWDVARKRVLVSSRLTYDQLTLSESRKEPETVSAAATGLMLKEALGLDPARLPSMSVRELALALAPVIEPERLESCVARLSLVATYFPAPGLVDFQAAPLGPVLLSSVQGCASLAELAALDWEGALLGACGLEAHALDELTPQAVALPSGRKARIQYVPGQAPWVESRLQDFFGLKRGPAILRGRLPLTLHLLAPNGRAVQVTQDLEGFWQRAYPELRNALSRRYPRHSWPEKP